MFLNAKFLKSKRVVHKNKQNKQTINKSSKLHQYIYIYIYIYALWIVWKNALRFWKNFEYQLHDRVLKQNTTNKNRMYKTFSSFLFH